MAEKKDFKLISDSDEQLIEQLLIANALSYQQVGELSFKIQERIAMLQNENLNFALSVEKDANNIIKRGEAFQTSLKKVDNRLNEISAQLDIVQKNIADIKESTEKK